MGVSGSGKSTIGRLLSAYTGWPFKDADLLHSPDRHRQDARRHPPHRRRPVAVAGEVAAWIAERHAGRRSWDHGLLGAQARATATCCARLTPTCASSTCGAIRSCCTSAITHRHGHFFPPALLDAQLADLEEPGPDEHPIIVPIGQSPEHTTHDHPGRTRPVGSRSWVNVRCPSPTCSTSVTSAATGPPTADVAWRRLYRADDLSRLGPDEYDRFAGWASGPSSTCAGRTRSRSSAARPTWPAWPTTTSTWSIRSGSPARSTTPPSGPST